MFKNSINENKTFAQFAEAIINNVKTTMNCIKLGEIVSFDKEKQVATVKILHRKTPDYNLALSGNAEYPLLSNVPVFVLQGGGASVTFPISAGDQCLLVFADYMIDNWWISGDVSTSDFPRQHDISDAIAIVGLNALPKVIQDYSNFLKLSYNDDNYIEVRNHSIQMQTENVNCSQDLSVTRDLSASTATAELHDKRGVSGVFTDTGVGASGISITIEDGIITAIN